MDGVRRWSLCLALLTGMSLAGAAPLDAARPGVNMKKPDVANCGACHEDIEPPGTGHEFACVRCHLPPASRNRPRMDHSEILPNPSNLEDAPDICGACHADIVRAVVRSSHAACPDIINRTRYLWGAQACAIPPRYSANAALRPLPQPPERPRTPAMLVDDFLRKRCLSCHLGVSAPGRYEGCAACHAPYADKNPGGGGEPAIPRAHVLQRNVSDRQCLSCHHGNHVGGDYDGLFERDLHPMFQQAVSRGREVPAAFGAAYHFLSRDAHAEAGLSCLDCHSGKEIMGLHGETSPSCETCHGGYASRVPDAALPAVESAKDGFIFHSQDGQTLPLPLLPETPSHDPQNHARLRCSACHAQWVFGEYGLSALRRDDGETPGQWIVAWRFRRWEYAALGVDEHGRISILRPKYQYLVSYVDRLGRTILDSAMPMRGDGSGPGWAFTPYTPHTTAPVGKRCDECHMNGMAAGRGMDQTMDLPGSRDLDLFKASPPIHPKARLLNILESGRLLNPDSRFRLLFARTLNKTRPDLQRTTGEER